MKADKEKKKKIENKQIECEQYGFKREVKIRDAIWLLGIIGNRFVEKLIL